jgi:NDP-sugar pyrophosphorylase family protein
MSAVKPHAVILAGGEGTRLRPLTHCIPKPVIPLVNRPFLHYQFDLLAAAGLVEARLLVGYRPDRVRAALGDRYGSIELTYVHEREPLGTGGAIGNACRGMEGSAVVTNGDVLTDLDLAAVLAVHRERGGAGTIVLTRVEDPRRYGVVVTEADGRIREFIEKPEHPPSDCINAGFYILDPEFTALIPEGRSSIERDVFPKALADGLPLYAYIHEGYWLDIGTLESYRRATVDLLDGRLDRFAEAARTGRIASPVPRGASVDARSVVGRDCSLGDGAVVEESILLPGATVGAGCRLCRCIVGPGTSVPAATTVEGGTVMPEGTPA